MERDTIAAISTGIGHAGIGMIRVSGDDAVRIVDRIFAGSVRLCDAPSHYVNYGHIVKGSEASDDGKTVGGSESLGDEKTQGKPEASGNGKMVFEPEALAKSGCSVVDEVLVTVFRAPRSYTREDIVEISSHGGSFVMKEILELVFAAGARPAEPGEFTKRAFLNGRIDLSQAESVMDIISADNERMLKNSLSQLSGVLSEKLRSLREEMLHEVAFIEAALDDPEHYDLNEAYSKKILSLVNLWRKRIGSLSSTVRDGRIMRDGIRTVIVGRPNAGKSSLLNALAGQERAIVTEIPGTTRDAIEEKVRLKDLVLAVTDTAGIRETEDIVEKIGVDRSLSEIDRADLILYMIDLNEPLQEEDHLIIERLQLEKTIALLNKADRWIDDSSVKEEVDAGLVDSSDRREGDVGFGDSSDRPDLVQSFFDENPLFPAELKDRTVMISAKYSSGFDKLCEIVHKLIDDEYVDTNVDIYVTNSRHARLLKDADVSLQYVEKSIQDGMPEDFLTGDLMDSYSSLGAIIGESVEDDLVDKIFHDFCMGK